MSSKYNIDCHTYIGNNRNFYVTADSKVWPCAHYSNADLNPGFEGKNIAYGERLEHDEYIVKLVKDNADWNNLDVTPLDDILEHDFFTTHVTHESWLSDNPPPMCIACCHCDTEE